MPLGSFGQSQQEPVFPQFVLGKVPTQGCFSEVEDVSPWVCLEAIPNLALRSCVIF